MALEYQILIILFIHWVADFLLQTETMAVKKSKDNYRLFEHVFVYTMVWFVVGVFIFKLKQIFIFCTLTFVFHFITDYYTSRWTSNLNAKKKYYGFPAFFSVIGLDQWLHFTQLIICYKLVLN